MAAVTAPSIEAQVSASLNQWSPAAAMSVPRSQACSAILQDGSVLVAGGMGSAGPVNTAEIYGSSGTFTVTVPMAQARSGAACATLRDGRVLVLGGDDGAGALNTAEIFDPSKQTWTPTGGLSVAREGHQVVVNDWGAVWVAGGTNAGGVVGALEQYSPSLGTFQAVGTLATPRSGFAMAALPNRQVVIAGGTDGDSTLTSVEIYNAITGTTSVAGTMTKARQNFAAAPLPDGTVLITGGMDANGNLLDSTEIFDPVKGVSTAGPNLLAPRANHFAYALPNNGAVIITGGSGSSGTLSTTEKYTPWSGAVQESAPMGHGRQDNVAAVLRPGQLLVAAGRNTTGSLNSSELFQYVTIGTDKLNYAPGTPVKISGSDWQSGEQVAVQITALPLNQNRVLFSGSGIADGSGNVTVPGFQTDRSQLGMTLLVSAAGRQFHAETTAHVLLTPDIAFTFTPPAGARPGSSPQVLVTVSGSGAVPTGRIVPCLNSNCGATGAISTTPIGATCNPVAGQIYTLQVGAFSSTCTFTINAIPAGPLLVGVEYSGDDVYSSEAPNYLNYAAQNLTSTVMLPPLTQTLVYGSTTPFVAQVTTSGSAPTRGVRFSVNGLPSGSPKPAVAVGGNNYDASFVPSTPLAVGGPYIITARSLGDSINATSSSTNSISVTVIPGGSTTTATFFANPIIYGQPVTVSGIVTGNGGTPTGTVTLTGLPGCVNVPLTSSGTYSCTITAPGPNVSASPVSITATYNPGASSGFLTSASAPSSLVITRAATQVSTPGISGSSPGTTIFTLQAQATAVSPSTAAVSSGSISFYALPGLSRSTASCSSGTLLANNVAVNSTGMASSGPVNIPNGSYTVCAVFAGANYTASTSSGLNLASPSGGTLTTLQAPTQIGGPAGFGTTTTISGTVTSTLSGNNPPIPGTLTFLDASNGNVALGSAVALVASGANTASASISVSNLSAGTHLIYTSFASGNGSFSAPSPNQSRTGAVVINSSPAPFALTTSAAANMLVGTTATFTATYTGGLLPRPQGTITFTTSNGTVCGPVALVTTSNPVAPGILRAHSPGSVTSATCTGTGGVGGLAVGPETVAIVFTDTDGGYTQGFSDTVPLTVVKVGSTTSLSLTNPATVGQIVTLTAVVRLPGSSLVPTGTVSFTLGGNTPLLNNCASPKSLTGTAPYTATCTFELTGPGGPPGVGVPISYTAVYNGDSQSSASAVASASLTSFKAATGQATLAVAPTTPVAGQPLTVLAIIPGSGPSGPAPTGTVTITGNGSNITVPLSNGGNTGTAAITTGTGPSNLPALPAGTYTYTLTYSGDSNYLGGGTATITFTVAKDNTITTLNQIGNSTVVTVAAAGPGAGTPTGSVSIYNGSASGAPVTTGTLVNGVFSANLGAGNYVAVYAGDANYLPSTSVLASITHPAATTTVTLTPSANPVPANQPVTLTASVIGSGSSTGPTGVVTFTDNGVLLGTVTLTGNAASITVTLPGGSNNITATYGGDAVYSGSSTTYGLFVGRPSSIVTVAASSTSTVFGQGVMLTARVTTSGTTAAGGTIQFFDGGILLGTATVVNGVATLTLANLPTGLDNLTVVYSGDTNYGSYSGSAGAFTVNKAPTLTSLTAATNNGQETLTATVTVVAPGAGTPTGTVQFIDTLTGSVVGTATLAGGMASITIPVTTDPIMAVYSGDGNFVASSSATVNTSTGSSISVVNAASYAAGYAPDEIVTVFGTALTTQTLSATLPLPITLGGIGVTVADSANVTRTATLFYVSPTQMSFLIPAGTATGTAVVTVTTANGVFLSTITVKNSNPGLFTANANGMGPLAAQVVTVTPGGTQTYSNTAALSGQTYVNAPIALTPAADSFYLLLYGTGLDHGSVVTVTINGTAYTPAYAGPQNGYAGLDQVNVQLPLSLAGLGSVNVTITVDGQISNAGTLSFQ